MAPAFLARRILREARIDATALGGAAPIADHVWLVGQHDTLKSAAHSTSIAPSLSLDLLVPSPFPAFLYPDTGDLPVAPRATLIVAVNFFMLRKYKDIKTLPPSQNFAADFARKGWHAVPAFLMPVIIPGVSLWLPELLLGK